MDVNQAREFLLKVLRVAAIGALFTPNKVDDTIVAFLQQAVANDAVMELLVALFNMFKDKQSVSKEDLTELLKKFGHV